MKVSQIIGVDVSKKTFDCALLPRNAHARFSNNAPGYELFTRWLVDQGSNVNDAFVVMEHTGHYSYHFEQFLHAHALPFTKVPALAIKRSMGMIRGKSDKQDSLRIAQYGMEKMAQLSACPTTDISLERLRTLHSTRTKLVANRAALLTSIKEMQFMCSLEDDNVIISCQLEIANCISAQILKLEEEMQLIVASHEGIKNNLSLLVSIKGVGKVMALALIIKTANFTKFTDGRKFACYCGTAPFENSSGSSIRGRTRVSHLADKPLKTLLSLCALSAVKSDPELKEYYLRRQAEGKSKMSTINVVRNKIIYRAFAVIKRQTPYQMLQKAA